MPVLGICGGQQLLAVALGGTLIQHIPDEVPNALAHEQPNPRHEPGHGVRHRAGHAPAPHRRGDEMAVNSAHHQAVRDPGPRAVVDATAPPTGSSRASRTPRHRFCLGVQWHPEFLIDPGRPRASSPPSSPAAAP